MPKRITYGLVSFLFFLLFLIFAYTNPIKYYLYLWLHTPKFVAVIALSLFSVSLFFSVKCLYIVFSKKENMLSGILLSTPVWIYFVGLIAWVMSGQ